MVPGTSRDDTQRALLEVEDALYRAVAGLVPNEQELILMSLGKLGATVGSGRLESSIGSTDTLGGVIVELVSSDERTVRADEVMQAWREAVVDPVGLDALTLTGQRTGPPGNDIDIRLRGGSTIALKSAAVELATLLGRYPGVSDVDDNLSFSKPEVILEVNARGRAMGFTTSDVGRQVRNAIDGAIAKRFARGDDEIWVRVQLAREAVDNALLERIYLRSPSGHEVALKEVANFREAIGFARILREDGQREVSVKGEVDLRATKPGRIIEAVQRDGLIDIASRFGVSYEFAGRAEDQRDTNSDMLAGAIVGLTFIYIILAWVFSSYARPLVVMAVIPLGFVGAVIGHGLWGVDLTILSIFAILGLSGIVINDSIVLVTTIDERLRSEVLIEALTNGSCDRLRAVLLTSATTIGGLTPLLFEKSLQAQFLIPMALTLVFGLAVTTFVVLLLVPALIMVQGDARVAMTRSFGKRQAQPSLD